ncbi:phage tail tape measure protein, partial [Clostridium botulinum]|nr:phage tail tape measure protein [Clostridium botulinum]NFO27246.1 phage tail tape measure protein [Clostridium botulinum]
MADGTVIIDTNLDQTGFEKGLNKLQSTASKGAKLVATSIAGVGAVLGGIGAYAIKVGSDFEAGMSKVKAISGATAEEMVQLTEKAKEMGASTKFSAGESAEAFQYMAMAGWKSGDMINGIAGIMNLAAASGEDLALTSDIVTDALTAFGLKASDSAHFADILASASSNSNTNVAMLGESFKYVAPLAGSLGYKAEDTSIALGLMANAGIKASQSGTTLKTALVNMAKPTSNMQAVMDQYGLSLQSTDGSMKSLKEVMDMLREKMGGLDKATKASASATLFGKESLAG